jgi:hypothetical protein
VVELAAELAQDLPGSIGGYVVEGINAIAECGDVSDRALHEDVLVADEDRADDANA